jgi:hypothetical protein
MQDGADPLPMFKKAPAVKMIVMDPRGLPHYIILKIPINYE